MQIKTLRIFEVHLNIASCQDTMYKVESKNYKK